ncbi:HlyD family efflux transporter periplasmic adaptor subunit [Nostoc linckia FACHB-104]|nr:HlyD family efflux transporter periplasmic adaptor subunit [Nostoc linckia FACHB-104]
MLYIHNQKVLPEVQEDFIPPVSAWTSLAGMFLVGSFGSAIALSSWVKYNVTVKAPASIRPTGEIRLAQPKMEGTIKRILVQENQVVKQGDIIAYLDDEQLQIKKSQLQGNSQQGRLQIDQIDAQIKNLDSQIQAEKTVIERTVAAAQSDLVRNQREYQERQVTTQTDLQVAAANLQKAYTDLQKAQADLEFADSTLNRYKTLEKEGAISTFEFEQKKFLVEQTKAVVEGERKAVEIAQAKVESARSAINPTDATVAIAKERIAQEVARGQANIATLNKERQALIQRRVEIQSQLIQFHKELEQVFKQLQDTVIRATTEGTILKLNLRNPGQVVSASDAIAEIVPSNAPLVIKAIIPTQDIKSVEVGQEVQLRIDSCPYPDYGTLKGVVNTVSPDVITSQNNSTNSPTSSSNILAASYFEATIAPESLVFGHQKHQCHIQLGMDAKAYIISKRETALQFMLRKARLITDI